MKTDIRIIKTKKAIEDAFLYLIETKGYSNIKIIDIANKAMVNRNTIYLHYGSKEGIIESIIKTYLSAHTQNYDLISYVKARNNRKKLENLYRAVFTVFDKNIELYRILLTDENLAGFFYNEIMKIKKPLLKLVKPTPKNQIALDFILNGVYGVLTNYTVYANGTIEENIKTLTDFTIINLRKIMYQL